MPRRKKQPHQPSYREKDGRGIVEFKPLTGSNGRRLPGPYGSKESVDAYNAFLQEVAQYRISGPPAPPKAQDQLTVFALFSRFLEMKAATKGKKTTEYQHYARLSAFLVGRGSAGLAIEFDALKLEAIRTAMIDKGWFRKSINRQVGRIRTVFYWGVTRGLVSPLVKLSIQAVRGLRIGEQGVREKPPIRPVAWDVAQQVLPYVPPVVQAMILLQYLTGMRSDELTSMQPQFIDTSGDVWVYAPGTHKTQWLEKTKLIAIGPQGQAAIRPYLDRAAAAGPEAFLFSPAIACEERRQARIANRKTKHTPSSLAYAYRLRDDLRDRYDSKTYLKAIGYGFKAGDRALAQAAKGQKNPPTMTRWHPHRLRHTRGTDTRAIYGVEGAQAQLGNTLAATEIYAERSLALALRIARETG